MQTQYTPSRVGFYGGGNMSRALIGGMLSSTSDFEPEQIWVYDRNLYKNQSLSADYGVKVAAHGNELATKADILIIAVKPQGFKTAVEQIQAALTQHRPLIISVAAGIRASSIEQWLDGDHAVVRAMPNTPSLINQGATGLYANKFVTPPQRAVAEQIMQSVGLVAWVENDADIDAVTALSGSGPAYFMLLIRALIEAATAAGLTAEAAEQLACQTAAGAARLVQHGDRSLDQLIEDITSPKGTTEQAILQLKRDQHDQIIQRAFEAARIRAEQLSESTN